MEKYPTSWRREGAEPESEDAVDSQIQAVRFLVNVVNATIYSSGQDYETAVSDFFPQLQALGHLIGAQDLDEVSAFLRRHARRL